MLFSPEHGIAGAEDKEGIGNAVDRATNLPVSSLYGAKPEDRRPKIADLEKLDAVRDRPAGRGCAVLHV